MAEVRLAELSRAHRARLHGILVSTGAFSTEEIDVALELFDTAQAGPSAGPRHDNGRHPERSEGSAAPDYEFIGAFVQRELMGYACFGPTPATDGTWDLYWLAVDPAAQGRGVGRALVQWVERELGRRGARLLVVETSSRADYEQTRSFYARGGYIEAARVKDFYNTADDRIIFTTRLSGEAGVQAR